MANSKIVDLTALAEAPAVGDVLVVVDVSDSTDDPTGTTKKITYANLKSGLAASGANSDITSLTALSTPLSVAQGGTGAATLTGIVKGNGTSAMTAVTAPTGAIVGISDSQTLTNKTITSPSIGGTVAGSATYTKPTLNGSVQALTSDVDGATITFDMSAANLHTVTLGGNRTLAVSNVSVGQCFILRLVQDGTGSRTVSWFTTLKWSGGSAPTLTTTAGKTDVFGFLCTSSGNYDAFTIDKNL